ncbi:MAG: hypothetical protein FWJ66_13500, partial [Caldibacillus sp.]
PKSRFYYLIFKTETGLWREIFVYRMGNKKYLFVLLLIIVLFLLIIHNILINTSYAYNEIFDKKAFKKMLEVIPPENIREIEIVIKSYQSSVESSIYLKHNDKLFSNILFCEWDNRRSNWESLALACLNERLNNIYLSTSTDKEYFVAPHERIISLEPFCVFIKYREGVFSDISFHKSLWNDRSTNWTHLARVYLNDRLDNIPFMTEDLDSGIFRTYFNGRRFSVSIPSLKSLFEEYEKQREDYFRRSDSGNSQKRQGMYRNKY